MSTFWRNVFPKRQVYMEGGIKAMLAISNNVVKRFEKEQAMNLDINPLMLGGNKKVTHNQTCC